MPYVMRRLNAAGEVVFLRDRIFQDQTVDDIRRAARFGGNDPDATRAAKAGWRALEVQA